MPNTTIENLNPKESFQLEVNDTSKFNKPFVSLILDNIFLGWLTNLKPNNFTVFKTIVDSLAFTLQPQSLQKLADSEVRIVGDYVLVRGHLCSYHQVILDFPYNQPREVTMQKLQKYTDLIEFLKNTGSIEFFWYDRNETLEDYQNYLRQLDEARDQVQSNLEDKHGARTATRLRNELEDHLCEIINLYSTRIREAFLIIPVPCNGRSIADVEQATLRLEQKQGQILTACKEAGITCSSVTGEHLHWFLSNFISCTARF